MNINSSNISGENVPPPVPSTSVTSLQTELNDKIQIAERILKNLEGMDSPAAQIPEIRRDISHLKGVLSDIHIKIEALRNLAVPTSDFNLFIKNKEEKYKELYENVRVQEKIKELRILLEGEYRLPILEKYDGARLNEVARKINEILPDATRLIEASTTNPLLHTKAVHRNLENIQFKLNLLVSFLQLRDLLPRTLKTPRLSSPSSSPSSTTTSAPSSTLPLPPLTSPSSLSSQSSANSTVSSVTPLTSAKPSVIAAPPSSNKDTEVSQIPRFNPSPSDDTTDSAPTSLLPKRFRHITFSPQQGTASSSSTVSTPSAASSSTPSATTSSSSTTTSPTPAAAVAPTLVPPHIINATFSKNDAESIFALVNLGSADVDSNDLRKDMTLTLSFTVAVLKDMIEKSQIPAEERESVQKLIRSYESGLEITREYSSLSAMTNQEEILAKKRRINELIIAKLNTEGEVFVPSGYLAKPYGHAIGLKLMVENKDGRKLIKGEVINRGEGVGYHGGTKTVGLREKVFPFLSLGEIPFESFERSNFLNCITELKIRESRVRTDTAVSDFRADTEYSIHDFYNIALVEWPGAIEQLGKKQKARGAQRGGTCTMKACLTPMKETLTSNTTRHIKLRMRIEAVELLLGKADLTAHNIPHLEWANAKINRALQKLAKTGVATPEEVRYCQSISQRIKEKINFLRAEQIRLKAEDPLMRVDVRHAENYAIPLTTSSLSESRASEERITRGSGLYPEPSLHKPREYEKVISAEYRDKSISSARRVTEEYLVSLPLATDPAWEDMGVDEVWGEEPLILPMKLLEVCFRLIRFSNTPTDRSNPKGLNRLTSRQIVAMANTCAGILRNIKRSNKIPQNLLDIQVATILKFIDEAGPQLRLNHPEDEARLRAAKEALNRVKENVVPSEEFSVFETKPQEFLRVDDLPKNPLVQHIYQILLRSPEYASQPLIMRDTAGEEIGPPSNLIERAVYLSTRLDYAKHWLPDYDLLFVMQKISEPFLVGLGINGRLDKVPTIPTTAPIIGYKFERDADGTAKMILPIAESIVATPTSRFLFEGVLSYNFYPWSPKDQTTIELLLDRRVDASSRNENRQLLLSRERAFSLGNAKIPAEEMEQLLSITNYDDLLVPQCIRFFQQHFLRLKDPQFQALLEAFLWTRAADGSAPILAGVLKDPNSQIAEQLLNFLENSIEKAHANHLLGAQLALTRILAQVYNYSKDAPLGRQAIAKRILEQSMGQLNDLANDRDTPEEKKTEIRHWLVCLYPYVKGQPSFVEICRIANHQLNMSGMRYDFNDRHILKTDYEASWADLTSEIIPTPPGRLPWFVTRSDQYVLSDKNPIVRKISDAGGVATYEVDPNTRIIIKGQSFQIHKQLQKMNGTHGWFAYDPKVPFPGGDYPNNHPCNTANQGSDNKKGYFTRETQTWVSVDAPLEAVILSTKSGLPLCRVSDNKIIHPKNPNLFLAKVYESRNPFIQTLLSLDNGSDVLLWRTADGTLSAAEYPTYGLTFELREGKWYSSKHKDFYIDSTTIMPNLEPHRHYLVLKKEGVRKEEKLVLMPNREVVSQKLDFRKKNSETRASEEPALFTYAMSQEGEMIIPDDPAKILYLIHLAFRSGHYKYARKLINKLALHPSQWGKREAEIYSWLKVEEDQRAKLENQHPYANALRVRLHLIADRSNKETDIDIDVSSFRQDYLAALDQINSLGTDWLSQEEEIQAIKMIKSNLPREKHTIIEARERELSSKRAIAEESVSLSPITIKRKPISKPSHMPLSLLRDKKLLPTITEKMQTLTSPLPVSLKMRPGPEFIFNFLLYYEEALKTPPSEELIALLRLSRNCQEPSFQFFHTILTGVINSSDKRSFPSVRTLKSYLSLSSLPLFEEELEKLFEKTKSIEIKWIDFDSKVSKGVPARVIDSASDAIRLERQTTPLESPVPMLRVTIRPDPLIDFFKPFLDLKSPESQERLLLAEIAKLQELKREVYVIPDGAEGCIRTSFERTVRGIDEKIAELQREIANLRSPGKVFYTLPTISERPSPDAAEKVARLGEALSAMNGKRERSLERIKEGILRTIHTYPEELRRQVDGGQIEPLTFQELLILFGRQDDEKILQSNPSLKPRLSELKREITDYLIQLTNHQQLVRAESLLQEATSLAASQGWEVAKNIADNFVDTLMAPRSYTADDPKLQSLLVFESISGLRLRQDQVEALVRLTEGSALEDIELEARTGFGKSQVLIPLWLFLTSRKDRLTMMTVPTALLPDQILHLRRTLGNIFSVGIQPIRFDREKAKDLKYLKWLNQQLEEAKREKRVLLIDIKSLHGIAGLALKQALLEHPGNETQSEIQNELIQIRNKLENHLSNFIDESRDCLDVRQRYDYAVGKPKEIDQELCQSVDHLYREVILSERILSRWNFEFLPVHDPSRQTVTEENFTRLQEELVDEFIRQKGLPLAIRDHLLGKELTLDVKGHIDRLTPVQKKHYAWFREQVGTHLRRTLLRTCGESYGLYKENRIAIPYLRGAPKPSSEFATVNDLVDFTVQANLKTPFSNRDIQDFIDSLKEQAASRGSAIERDLNYQFLARLPASLRLPPLADIKEADVANITAYLNDVANTKEKLSFISLYVLPKITSYSEKISGTSFTVVSAQKHVHAASGTVDPDTLPSRIKPMEKLSAPIGNLLAMYKKSNLISVVNKNPERMLDEIFARDPSYRVIIDAAGRFNDLPQERIAHSLLAKLQDGRPPVRGVTYYDNEGRCMILERGSSIAIPREESRLATDEIFVFIRQSKAVGSDTPMSPTAKGFVTIGKDTAESFFLQAAGRMRGLQIGQSIDFVATQEDMAIFADRLKVRRGEPLRVSHIFKHVKLVEANQKGKDYFFSLKLFLEDLVEKRLWKNINRPERLIEAMGVLKKSIVEFTEKDPLNSLSSIQRDVPTRKAVELLKQSVLSPLKELGNAKLNVAIAEIEEEYDRYVDYSKLPSTIFMGDTQSEAVVAEAEAEEESEVYETEQDQLGEEARDLPSLSISPHSIRDWDGDYTHFLSVTRPKETICNIPIHYSPNFMRLDKNTPLDQFHPLARKRAQQFVLKVNSTGEVSLVPLSLYDAAAVLKRMKTNRGEAGGNNYYLISGGDILASAADRPGTKLSDVLRGDNLARISILCKVLSADRALSAKETEWLTTHKREAQEIVAFAQDYLAVWPDLRPLFDQLKGR